MFMPLSILYRITQAVVDTWMKREYYDVWLKCAWQNATWTGRQMKLFQTAASSQIHNSLSKNQPRHVSSVSEALFTCQTKFNNRIVNTTTQSVAGVTKECAQQLVRHCQPQHYHLDKTFNNNQNPSNTAHITCQSTLKHVFKTTKSNQEGTSDRAFDTNKLESKVSRGNWFNQRQ